MPSVDAFLEFVVQEMSKEGQYRLVVDAPDNERYWLAGPQSDTGEGLAHGDSLTEVLNHISLAFSFTHKPLTVAEQDSLVKQVAIKAAQHDSALVIHAPSNQINWIVEVEGLGIRSERFTLKEALMQTLKDLNRLGE